MAALALRSDILLRPLPAILFLPAAVVVLFAGAAYCLGYEGLTGGIGLWPTSLLWSAYAVWPWLFLFEWVKRREAGGGAPLGPALFLSLLVAVGLISIALEYATDWLRHVPSANAGLQLLRRLPAIGATLLLLLLARRERQARGADSVSPEDEVSALRLHAADIRWVRAADNYVELHLAGRVMTRRVTMREAALVLAPFGFVRIHRSFIVDREQVAELRGGRVRMRDGTELPVGRAFAANLSR